MSITFPYGTSNHQLYVGYFFHTRKVCFKTDASGSGQTMVFWRSWRHSPPEKALPGEGTKISTDLPLRKRLFTTTQKDFWWKSVQLSGLLVWIFKSVFSCMFIAIISQVSSVLWCYLLQSIQSVHQNLKFRARKPLYGQAPVNSALLSFAAKHPACAPKMKPWATVHWAVGKCPCYKVFGCTHPIIHHFEGGFLIFFVFLFRLSQSFCSFLKQILFMHLLLCHVQEK